MLDDWLRCKCSPRSFVTEPEEARAPFMLGASKLDIVLAGWKWGQGKCIVNSIFKEQAKLLKRHGAAVDKWW